MANPERLYVFVVNEGDTVGVYVDKDTADIVAAAHGEEASPVAEYVRADVVAAEREALVEHLAAVLRCFEEIEHQCLSHHADIFIDAKLALIAAKAVRP